MVWDLLALKLLFNYKKNIDVLVTDLDIEKIADKLESAILRIGKDKNSKILKIRYYQLWRNWNYFPKEKLLLTSDADLVM